MKANRLKILGIHLSLLVFLSLPVLAEPRSPLPPWPEQTLGIWGFNEVLTPLLPTRTALGADTAQMQESWSGYALTRDLFAVLPVAIPATEPGARKPNFTPSQGAIRFWFRPGWSSTSLAGTGPGNYARLIEMVGLSTRQSEVCWSLYLNPEGTTVYLSGTGARGATDYLKAEVNWQAGGWHLIVLNYDAQETTLFVDAAPAAAGPGLAPVAPWKTNGLGLVIGSDLAAAGSAQGQFDELCTFEEPVSAADQAFYFRGMWRTVALGALGTPKEERWKEQWLNAQVQVAAKDSGVPGLPGDIDPEGDPLPTAQYVSPVYPSNALWLSIEGVSNGVALVTLHGTVPDTLYELRSREEISTNAIWQPEGTWLGAPNQDWTPAMVTVGLRTNQLFLSARSWMDSTGSGLPDWWQMQYFGQVGVEGYADPDGDGWVNLQEYQNGTSPNGFNTPPAPGGFAAMLDSGNSCVNLSWKAANGAVSQYVIERSDPVLDEWGHVDYWTSLTPVMQLNGSALTATDTGDFIPRNYTDDFMFTDGGYWEEPNRGSVYQVHAVYANGVSAPAITDMDAPLVKLRTEVSLVRNSMGRWILAVEKPQETVEAVCLLWNHTHEKSYSRYQIPIQNINDGCYLIPDVLVTNLQGQNIYVQMIGTNGVSSMAKYIGSIPDDVPCFVDGRQHLLQNLIFVLRAAPLHGPSWWSYYTWNSGITKYHEEVGYLYGYSCGYEGNEDILDKAYIYGSEPFIRNYSYRNLILDTNTPGPFVFEWDGCFTTTVPAPAVLAHDEPYWISQGIDEMWLQEFEVTLSSTPINENINNYFLTMAPGQKQNWWGLGELPGCGVDTSVIGTDPDTGLPVILPGQYKEITPGTTATWSPTPPVNYFSQFEKPEFDPTGYYFAPVRFHAGDWGIRQEVPLPIFEKFAVTNQTQLMIGALAQSMIVGGWSKLAIANGDPNKFAYLGQYFDKAYKASPDGTRSTNETGILSPYGEFFATEPGRTFLTTMPDGVSPNVGECMVNVIKLQLDVNHDGVMETAWNSPDNTSSSKPFVFWANNDFDRLNWVDGDDLEEDDMEKVVNSVYYTQRYSDRDYAFRGYEGKSAIPCMRDLEDYARLWMPGLSNLMTVMPTHYTVRLTVNGDGQIRVFRAIEPEGGASYLFDEVTASNQVAQSISLYVGVLSSSSPITLSGRTNNLGEHFIWCGSQRGTAEVHLQILDGDQNLLADTVTHIEIKDIKEMYERWTVGDKGSVDPAATAFLAVEDLPAGASSFQYGPPEATNTPYILHVHGWNMERWDKDRFAETAYKRLYWQGYQGRFGSFRWPTLAKFDLVSWQNPITSPAHYDQSESNAWASGPALKGLLASLNTTCPNNVYLIAHSMGNVVAGEALRLAGTNQIVHTYVAMQAAVPSHAYDASAPTRSLGALDSNTSNRYAEYWQTNSPPYFSGVGGAANYVNFYNPQDYALAASHWQLNQSLKPDSSLSYEYYPIGGWYNDRELYRQTGLFSSRELGFPTNTYELFSFCVEARCYALGAQQDVAGRFISSNQANLFNAPFNFGQEHKGHSGQFRSTNMKRSEFWRTLLQRMDLNP